MFYQYWALFYTQQEPPPVYLQIKYFGVNPNTKSFPSPSASSSKPVRIKSWLSAGDTVIFYHLGKQVPHLCCLPKNTEMLHQVGKQTPILAPRHCVPTSVENGSSFHVSRKMRCPPRIYTLPTGRRTQCSSGSIAAVLAASKRTSCIPVPAAEETWLPASKCQVCGGPSAGARALTAQGKQPPAGLALIHQAIPYQWNSKRYPDTESFSDCIRLGKQNAKKKKKVLVRRRLLKKNLGIFLIFAYG